MTNHRALSDSEQVVRGDVAPAAHSDQISDDGDMEEGLKNQEKRKYKKEKKKDKREKGNKRHPDVPLGAQLRKRGGKFLFLNELP